MIEDLRAKKLVAKEHNKLESGGLDSLILGLIIFIASKKG